MNYHGNRKPRKLKQFGRPFDTRDPMLRAALEVCDNVIVYDEMLDVDAGVMVPTLRSLRTGQCLYGSVEDGNRLAHRCWCETEEKTSKRPKCRSTIAASREAYRRTGKAVVLDFYPDDDFTAAALARAGFAIFSTPSEVYGEAADTIRVVHPSEPEAQADGWRPIAVVRNSRQVFRGLKMKGRTLHIVGEERVEAMLAAERRLAEAGRLTDVE